MRWGEALIFLFLAAAVHAGVWVMTPTSSGSVASGASGADEMTLTAATAAQRTMIADWQRTPDALTATPESPSPAALSQNDAVQMTAPERRAPATPGAPLRTMMPPADALPRIDRQPAPPPVTEAQRKVEEHPPETRPKARPTSHKTVQAAPGAAPQAERRARGDSEKAQGGAEGADQTQSAETQRRHALRAQWGAQIHAKVQRSMRYPRGSAATGTAKLALKVAPSGHLQAISLLKSSGDSKLDDAALRAVQRAGRFSKAPPELSDAVYAFSLSLTFRH